MANARVLDTALRVPGADGDAAAAAFCAAAAPARSSAPVDSGVPSALRWCAGVLHRGVPEHGAPAEVKGAVFVVGVALQVLLSCSGADHRQQFGHVARDGSHLRWPSAAPRSCARHGPRTWTRPRASSPRPSASRGREREGPRRGSGRCRCSKPREGRRRAADDDRRGVPSPMRRSARGAPEARAHRRGDEGVHMRARDVAVPGRARDERPTGGDDERGPRESGRPPERARVADAFGPTSLGSSRGCVLEPRGDGDKNNPAASSPDEASAASTLDVFPDAYFRSKKSPRRLAPRARARRASRVGLGLPLRRVGVGVLLGAGLARVHGPRRVALAAGPRRRAGVRDGPRRFRSRDEVRGSAPVRGPPRVGVARSGFFGATSSP